MEEVLLPLIKAYAKERVRIIDIDHDAKTCTYISDPETEDLSEQAEQDMQKYIQQIVDDVAKSIQGGRHIARRAREYSTLNQMISFLTQYMNMSDNEIYEMLTINSKKQRVTRFIDYLLRQKEEVSLKMEVNEKMTREASDFYRRQAIERQIQTLKDQLGDDQSPQQDPNDYISRINALPLSDTTRKALLEDAHRLEKINEQSQDAEVLRTYLDFALSLPWKKEEAFEPDLKEARAILDSHHAGMDKVKERILQHLAVMQLRHSMKGSAILLVGPPGTGQVGISIFAPRDQSHVVDGFNPFQLGGEVVRRDGRNHIVLGFQSRALAVRTNLDYIVRIVVQVLKAVESRIRLGSQLQAILAAQHQIIVVGTLVTVPAQFNPLSANRCFTNDRTEQGICLCHIIIIVATCQESACSQNK